MESFWITGDQWQLGWPDEAGKIRRSEFREEESAR